MCSSLLHLAVESCDLSQGDEKMLFTCRSIITGFALKRVAHSMHWLAVDLNLFKVLGHTWDHVGSPPGQ
jgi:hypothetical protein